MTYEELTFMQQPERWVEWPFSLSEEEQLAIHSKDFNVFMATGRIQESSCDTQKGVHLPLETMKRKTHHRTILTGSFLGMM